MDSGERKRWALKREPTFLDAALAMDCMYGFQSIVGENVNPSKRKLVSSCNSVLLIFTGTKRGSLWRLKESNFVNDEAIKTTLRPLDIRTDLFNESKMNLHKKITDSRQKSEIKRRNDESIPKILKETIFFVGCTIRHLLKENKEGPETGCTGTVKAVDKYNIADPRHKYSVEYDDDLGAQYVFPLMLDMEKGDCFIIKDT